MAFVGDELGAQQDLPPLPPPQVPPAVAAVSRDDKLAGALKMTSPGVALRAQAFSQKHSSAAVASDSQDVKRRIAARFAEALLGGKSTPPGAGIGSIDDDDLLALEASFCFRPFSGGLAV